MKYKVTRPVFHKGCNYMTGQLIESEKEILSPAFEKVEEEPENKAEEKTKGKSKKK